MSNKRFFKNCAPKGKKAFTLAEVLITVTIVGVVAALTLPTLLHRIDKVRYANQYKRTKSVLFQALQRLESEGEIENYDSSEQFLGAFKKYAKIGQTCPAGDLKGCFPENFTAGSLEYNVGALKTSRNLGHDWAVDTNIVGFVLLDGTSVIMAYNTQCDADKLESCAAFAFDMNGINTTNRFTINGESDIGTLNASFFELCGLPIKFDENGMITNTPELYQLVQNDPNLMACVQDNQDKLDKLAESGTGATGDGGACLAAGTMVALFDGTLKPIEQIDYNDEILVWNFDEGRYDSSKPVWIKVEEKIDQYNLLKFSDGSWLKTINQHRIFNKEAGRFTYPMSDDTPIGTTTLLSDGREVTLVSKEVVHEPVKYYNLITEYHFNCFANGICTSNRFSNIYNINDYKYVKENRDSIAYDEYSDIISKDWYDKFRLSEMPKSLADRDYLMNLKSLDKKSSLVGV